MCRRCANVGELVACTTNNHRSIIYFLTHSPKRLYRKYRSLYLYTVLKAFWHSCLVQTNGFCFVCTRSWIFRLYDVKNGLPQSIMLHLKRYSPSINKWKRYVLVYYIIKCVRRSQMSIIHLKLYCTYFRIY